ncbi:poly [ADP-ribose] polymerase [Plakobranchus ocellatus]|uniref:Poly [ADP-ribose] polymerase n=1 Tax=Plakobranchus ocellatus TaxID=259542 RepID=A0AAV4AIR1_9GAST|nr:poly [ADP-ribose] polymerase [Plakobranchus ocellatus]
MCPARIKLDRCDILTVKADVCVCAVHRSRDMKVYPLSKQVLRKGGQAVQNELYEAGSKNSEELEMGQVEMTDAGKLPNFKKVMFINLRSYIDGNEKYLQQSLQECLELAATLRYTSIAVPALGTGGLNYPPEKVASATVDAVALHNLQFKDKSSVESVNIVLLDSDIELIKTYLRVCVTGSVNLSDEEEDDETGASGGVREDLSKLSFQPAISKKKMAFEFMQSLTIENNLDGNEESDIEIGEISEDEDDFTPRLAASSPRLDSTSRPRLCTRTTMDRCAC